MSTWKNTCHHGVDGLDPFTCAYPYDCTWPVCEPASELERITSDQLR